jgi:putative FmdB family regulatory protein
VPIYDYRCDHCGHVFSAVQSFTDATLERCPSCGKKPRKLLASPAIVFKGSGWYKTDSRSAKSKKDEATKEGAPAEAKPEAGAARGTQSRGDASTDAASGTKPRSETPAAKEAAS